KPALPPDSAQSRGVQPAAEKIKRPAKCLEYPATPERRQPTVAIIEPDQNEPARLDLAEQGFEAPPGISGVMQNAVGDHDVDAAVAEGRTKQVHLQESSV